jgi:hypothetical protein
MGVGCISSKEATVASTSDNRPLSVSRSMSRYAAITYLPVFEKQKLPEYWQFAIGLRGGIHNI